MPETYFIRRAVIQLDTAEPEYRWQDDAACAFQPHTLFEIAAFDDRIAEGIVPKGSDPSNELTRLNLANFERAKEICNTCPVWHLCYLEADESDFEQTVRAGITPTLFNPNLAGRNRVVAKPKVPKIKPVSLIKAYCCSKGHYNWAHYKTGKRRCRTCNILKHRKNREAERLARTGSTKKTNNRQHATFERGVTCKHGHDEWCQYTRTKRGKEYVSNICVPCKKNAAQRMRDRGAKLDA